MSIAKRLTILAIVMGLALTSFTWPAGRLEPRELPIGVVRPAPIELSHATGFDVRTYATRTDAREAVRDREVYGVIAGGTAYVATGASPAVAMAIRQAAPEARVVDLAPGTQNDPRVATLGALAMPLTLLGVVTALLAFFTARTGRERLTLIAGAGVLAGVAAALITHTWLDALPGTWLGIAGVVALTVTAIGAAITGLASHIGRPGIGLGAVTMMLVANPWSGLSSAPELLPEPAGTLGQILPTGAAGDLLRSVAFFDGAAAAGPLLTLTAWAVAGLALLATAARRREGVAVAQHGHAPAAAAA